MLSKSHGVINPLTTSQPPRFTDLMKDGGGFVMAEDCEPKSESRKREGSHWRRGIAAMIYSLMN